jgi:hypothetical protein
MRGLPYKIQEQEIADFFSAFDVQKRDIYIEETKGRRTGSALVIFET